MPAYIDGFLVPVPKRNRAKYLAMARTAGKVWMEHGALAYYECAPDFVGTGEKQKFAFGKGLARKADEEVWFSFVIYKSKAHQKAVTKKVHVDPRITKYMHVAMPFDMSRLHYGGFVAKVQHAQPKK